MSCNGLDNKKHWQTGLLCRRLQIEQVLAKCCLNLFVQLYSLASQEKNELKTNLRLLQMCLRQGTRVKRNLKSDCCNLSSRRGLSYRNFPNTIHGTYFSFLITKTQFFCNNVMGITKKKINFKNTISDEVTLNFQVRNVHIKRYQKFTIVK